MKRLLIVCLSILCATAAAQTAPPAPHVPAPVSGCVTKLPNIDRYVLASAGRCIFLSGTFNPAQVANREVVLRGTLMDPYDIYPLTLKVDSTIVVKDACSQTCTLESNGTRGIHNKEKPGSLGGTAGFAPDVLYEHKEKPGSPGGTAGAVPATSPPAR